MFLCCKTMNLSHLSAADMQARDLKGDCDTLCFRSPRKDSELLSYFKCCYTAQYFPLVAKRVTVNRCLQFKKGLVSFSPKILVTYWMKLMPKKDIWFDLWILRELQICGVLRFELSCLFKSWLLIEITSYFEIFIPSWAKFLSPSLHSSQDWSNLISGDKRPTFIQRTRQ